MQRCAASFVVATYTKVRLTPHDLRALPLNVFEQPLDIDIPFLNQKSFFMRILAAALFKKIEMVYKHLFSSFKNILYKRIRFVTLLSK